MSYTELLLTVVCALMLLGLFRLDRRSGRWFVASGVVSLFLISWPPVDWLLSRPLEMWYPIRPFDSRARPTAIGRTFLHRW